MRAQDQSMPVFLCLGCLTLAVCLVVPTLSNANSSSPPNARTGAPGEGTCHDCHNSFDLNSGSGSLSIIVPDEFEAGETYEIVVSLEQAGQTRWGFEFTPLEIGTCTITDAQNTQADISGGKTYVKQTLQGTYAGETPSVMWSFQWTAPANPPDEVTFYASGNAANNNGSTSGDYVYTASQTTTLIPTDADERAPTPVKQTLLTSHPNPARDCVVLTYRSLHNANASIEILDVAGALVWQQDVPAGVHSLRWNTRDRTGAPVPSGLYFCRAMNGNQSQTSPIVLLK